MFGFKKRPAPRLQVVYRDCSRLTLEQWRSVPDLVKVGMKFMSDPLFRQMLDVCRNEHPIETVHIDADMYTRAIHQARIEGYMLCLNNLESMGSIVKHEEPIESTFEPPEEDDAA
jgi:hypothetical protein